MITRQILKMFGKFKYKTTIFEKRGGGGRQAFHSFARGLIRDGKEYLELYDTGETVKAPPSEYVFFPKEVFLTHHGSGQYSYVSYDTTGVNMLKIIEDAVDKNAFADQVFSNKRDFEKKSWLQQNATVIAAVFLLIGGGICLYIINNSVVETLKAAATANAQSADLIKQVATNLAGVKPPV